MKMFSLKNAVAGSILSSFILLGAVGFANGQNYNDQYRQWQDAQREAQREYQDFLRSRSRDDYRDWQRAQQRAQREYAEYQRSANGRYRNDGYNNGYNNNGYNSNGYYSNRVGTSRVYRVYRNGSYYETDNRGAELLRQAVNSGYQQGFQQGQMDARYGRNSGYYGNNVYRSGTYGYQSYIDRSQYQYYFQQGFQKGYEDGFNNQYRYGTRSNNGVSILSSILGGILNLSQY
ncbi:MAG TPA: hypothetical protein VMZ26_05160 [Pyrinomonadaceae bacterium]|nr:hypothetical protein [Pyrinomonadaceae bacterium]